MVKSQYTVKMADLRFKNQIAAYQIVTKLDIKGINMWSFKITIILSFKNNHCQLKT